ncbi:CobW family GTP-binding protein [Thermus sediminis]|uniref:CobW family GTP-binding protein n=1 Tax=Thermus sediminis TaxID=1761908 RepID=UPI000E3DB123|nr:GTP-binding protein [Thermus sediminis]
MALGERGRDGRVPVTLITGFLGSGKTTLVNRLLRERPGMAVLVNDFGEVPLDGDLIPGERVVPLADGCVCCGRSQDLVWALARLARGEPPGHLLLETSGLAHPGPVLATLASPGVKEAYRLAGVVALADALHLEAHLAYPEAGAQLALADLILLSKVDLAPGGEEALDRLKALNPTAQVRPIVRGEGVGVEEVLFPPRSLRILPPGVHLHAHARVESLSLVLPGEASLGDLEAWLKGVLLLHGSRLLRGKGVVRLREAPKPLVFHLVLGHLELGFAEARDGLNRLVFIGEGLDRRALEEGARWVFGGGT